MMEESSSQPIRHRKNFILCFYKMLERIPEAIPAFVLRLGVALVFYRSGLTKLQEGSWSLSEQTIFLFRDEYHMPFPEITAHIAACVELLAPLMLLFGLGSRIAAAAMLGMTLTIQLFIYPESYPDHLLWLGPLLYIILRGPGKLSVDYLIRRSIDK